MDNLCPCFVGINPINVLFQEDDPFDEAFDLLAKDSINKFALQDIEKDLNDDDLFDTTKADTVLNLASIANLEKVILNSSYPSKKICKV